MAVFEVGAGKTYATVQLAADAVFTAAGDVDFTEAHELRIYDGTYTECVLLNSGLKPLPRYRLVITAADGETAVQITNNGLASHPLDTAGVQSINVKDIELTNTINGKNGLQAAMNSLYCSGVTFSGTYSGLYMGGSGALFEDCVFSSGASGGIYGSGLWRRCTFEDTSFFYGLYARGMRFDACIFRNGPYFHTHGTQAGPVSLATLEFYNCTFYNGAYGLRITAAGQGLGFTVKNCIFHTITSAVYSVPAGVVLRADCNRNCYYNCAKIADTVDTDYTTLADWQAFVDHLGNSPDADSIDSDPEFVDAPNDDFSLTLPSVGDDGSPCYRAGVNAGVERDQAGNLFHERHLDIGSWSSGQEDSSTPSFTVADDETGTSFTVTVTANDPKDEIFVRYSAPGETTWTEFGTSRRGSGTLQVTGATELDYDVHVIASRNGSSISYGAAASTVKSILVTDGTFPRSWESICNTIRGRFKTEVVDKIGGLPTQYDNDGAFDKPEGARWCRFSVRPADSVLAEIGGGVNRYRTPGVAIAQVFVPVGEGDKDSLVVADFIKSAFRAVTASGVKFKTPALQVIGRNGDEWQVNVTIPFYVDEVT